MVIGDLTRVVVDTSACIYFLDADPTDRRRRFVAELFERIDATALTVILSPVTVAELLVQPIRHADVVAEAMVRLFLTRLTTVTAATGATASAAAALRARYGLRLPDAFILAAAGEAAVDAVVGNDQAWKRVDEIRYIHIDDEIED